MVTTSVFYPAEVEGKEKIAISEKWQQPTRHLALSGQLLQGVYFP